MSNDYFKAQGWFKNYATSSEDSRGMFQQLVKDDEEDFRLASAESDKIKEEMNTLEPITNDDPPELLIYHCFDVKGVGTVILGKVTNGTIKQYDNLKLYPQNIDVLIKSIQMHDDPVTDSVCPARVGIAVKGAKPDEVGRGDVISVEDAVEIKTEMMVC